MEHWVKDFQVDGFRCDVGDAIPLDFWEEARARLERLRPDLVILSEGQRSADQVKAFDIDSFLRRAGAEEIVSVVNLSNRSVRARVRLPGRAAPAYGALLSRRAKTVAADGRLAIELEGLGYFVGKK